MDFLANFWPSSVSAGVMTRLAQKGPGSRRGVAWWGGRRARDEQNLGCAHPRGGG